MSERGLEAVSDRGEIDRAVHSVLAENAEHVARYRAGEQKVLNFLMGQVMRRTGGKADPGADPAPPTFADGLASMQVIDAVREAAASGTRVRVERG